MNKSFIPRLVNIILIIAFVSPLVYGLYLYNWDIERFIGFKASEVSVNISYTVDQVYVKENYIVFSIEIVNTGDVPLTIRRLDATLNATLDMQMHISSKSEYVFPEGRGLDVGESVNIDLKFPVASPTGGRLYFKGIEYMMELSLEAKVYGEPIVLTSVIKGGLSR